MPDPRRNPRGANRPAARQAGQRPVRERPVARPAGPRGAQRSTVDVVARPKLTGRAVILLLVLAALVISYASSMRAYLNQRAHIADTRAKIAAAEANIKALEREKKRWEDAAYVESEARRRLGWVLPGEVGYTVIGRDGKPLASDDQFGDPASVVPLNHAPVWAKLYQSVLLADHPPKPTDPNAKITTKNK